MTFAIVVCATFFVVAVVFFVYDWCVKRRNKELVKTAVQSHKVVASLFPGEMKNEILKRQSVRVMGINENAFKSEKAGVRASPIAQEYEHTTVFFGDLAGFTAW